MNHLEVQQGTKEWFDARKCKFTSSELHKLFSSGKRSMTEEELKARTVGDRRTTVDEMFGEGAKTYILEKVAEILTDGASAEYKAFETNATEWGKEYEPYARERFTKETGLTVVECGFFEYNPVFGGSPDGFVEDGAILEIKCPHQTYKHIANLSCKDAKDLKKLNKDYYIQLQGNMLAADATKGYFVSYDWRLCKPELQIKIIEVERDEEMITEAINRLAAAADIMNDTIKKAIGI